MDYLDPKKERAQTIRLIIGYVLIGVAILIATLILLYQAYGFGLGKDGEVIQSGLVFVSSEPDRAQIYLNNSLYKDNTNAKLQLPEGQYSMELKRTGYDTWKRIITVAGGSVQHFDYPKLFPTDLKTTNLKTYADVPGLATQSPDRRWLIIQQTVSPLNFELYDLADFKNVTDKTTTISLPTDIVTGAGSGTHSLKLAEWSTDNRHVMLQHTYATATASGNEYLLLDRQDPTQSINLTRTLALTPLKELQLHDKKFDQYYIYDTEAHTVGRTSIDAAGAVTPVLDQVLSYKPYGKDLVLYITDKTAPAGQVSSVLYDSGQTYKIRDHGSTGPFLIDLAQYRGDWYIVAGASSDNKVYVYKNPQQVRKASNTAALVPVQIIRVTAPSKLLFSTNTEHIMVENGTSFADYDADTDKGYRFTSEFPLDPPAVAASWMDGQRLQYISDGKVVILDYDNINDRALAPASPNYVPFFDRDYDTLYTLTPGPTGGMTLTQTSMHTPADQ